MCRRKNHGVCFVFACYYWAWACPEVWLIYLVTLQEKNQFPLPSSYQLQIASLLGVNIHVSMCPHVHVPLLVLGYSLQLKPVQACVCCHSLHE